MEPSLKPVIVGVTIGTIVAALYYPLVILVGLLSYFATTPPPNGPLPSEMRLRDAAFNVLSFPSRVVSGPGRGSVWSAVNPSAHGVAIGLAAGVLTGLTSMAAGSVGPRDLSGRRPEDVTSGEVGGDPSA